MKSKILRPFDDFLWMMFPSVCAACGKPLFTGEAGICTLCRYYLPRTGFHLEKNNPVEKQFWGKVRIKEATAYYYFSKGERVQRLIHQLKYKGRKDAGVTTGKLMGLELCNSVYNEIELIIPVPLHKNRLRQRGYNQSDCLAEGLSAGLKKNFSTEILTRREATSTQTRKHRFDRYRNVENIFEVKFPARAQGKKILLVDDVVTTGSTLISCAEALLKIPGTEIYIAALACA